MIALSYFVQITIEFPVNKLELCSIVTLLGGSGSATLQVSYRETKLV